MTANQNLEGAGSRASILECAYVYGPESVGCSANPFLPPCCCALYEQRRGGASQFLEQRGWKSSELLAVFASSQLYLSECEGYWQVSFRKLRLFSRRSRFTGALRDCAVENKMKCNVLCEKLISVGVERRKSLFLNHKLIERDHVKHKDTHAPRTSH